MIDGCRSPSDEAGSQFFLFDFLEDPTLVHPVIFFKEDDIVFIESRSIGEIEGKITIFGPYLCCSYECFLIFRFDFDEGKLLRSISFCVIICLQHSIKTQIVIILVLNSDDIDGCLIIKFSSHCLDPKFLTLIQWSKLKVATVLFASEGQISSEVNQLVRIIFVGLKHPKIAYWLVRGQLASDHPNTVTKG